MKKKPKVYDAQLFLSLMITYALAKRAEREKRIINLSVASINFPSEELEAYLNDSKETRTLSDLAHKIEELADKTDLLKLRANQHGH